MQESSSQHYRLDGSGPVHQRTGDELEDYKLHRRFDRIGRLVGDVNMARLMQSHVIVVGLGGVGSWAAEALIRSGIGTITIVDFDRICITNANRQVQALHGVIGKPKADVLRDRLQLINRKATVISIPKFYHKSTVDEIFATRPDYVVDAIDNVTTKCHLLAYCRDQQIPVVCSTGASGRMDPTRIRTTDLAHTTVDPLAKTIRKLLRQEHAFPRSGDFGIEAVFSDEPIRMPKTLTYDKGKGFQCVCPGGANDFHSCESRNIIYGTSGFVTGSFGFTCASVVVRRLIELDDA